MYGQFFNSQFEQKPVPPPPASLRYALLVWSCKTVILGGGVDVVYALSFEAFVKELRLFN